MENSSPQFTKPPGNHNVPRLMNVADSIGVSMQTQDSAIWTGLPCLPQTNERLEKGQLDGRRFRMFEITLMTTRPPWE